ncbi:hypothetical protein ACVWXQ_006685 [Bradyrhizobium sp. S3.14.4]
MTDTNDIQHDIQHFIDEFHAFAETLFNRGACPNCVAQAMISEAFHLANSAGELDAAKETADRYVAGDRGLVLRNH